MEREISLKILKEKMRFFNDDLVRLATIFVEMVNFFSKTDFL